MAVSDRNALLENLPSVGALQRPEETPDGLSETFGKVRSWLRKLHLQGDLSRAGHVVQAPHRHAIIRLLQREAGDVTSVRRAQANQLLSLLRSDDGWDPAGIIEVDIHPLGINPRRQECSRGSASSWEELPVGFDIALPSIVSLKLENPEEDMQDTFQKFRRWVNNEHRSGQLAESWSLLGSDYRCSVSSFLDTFVVKRSVFRSQVGELRGWLAAAVECGPCANASGSKPRCPKDPSACFAQKLPGDRSSGSTSLGSSSDTSSSPGSSSAWLPHDGSRMRQSMNELLADVSDNVKAEKQHQMQAESRKCKDDHLSMQGMVSFDPLRPGGFGPIA